MGEALPKSDAGAVGDRNPANLNTRYSLLFYENTFERSLSWMTVPRP
jgi:hypothetical protein